MNDVTGTLYQIMGLVLFVGYCTYLIVDIYLHQRAKKNQALEEDIREEEALQADAALVKVFSPKFTIHYSAVIANTPEGQVKGGATYYPVLHCPAFNGGTLSIHSLSRICL